MQVFRGITGLRFEFNEIYRKSIQQNAWNIAGTKETVNTIVFILAAIILILIVLL